MTTITKKKQPQNQLTLLQAIETQECDSFNVSQAVIRCLKHNEVYQQPKAAFAKATMPFKNRN